MGGAGLRAAAGLPLVTGAGRTLAALGRRHDRRLPGRRLAAASEDGTVRLWDLQRQQLKLRLFDFGGTWAVVDAEQPELQVGVVELGRRERGPLELGDVDELDRVVDEAGGWVFGVRVRAPDGTKLEGLKYEAR